MAMPAYVLAYTYTDFLQFVGPVQTGLRESFGWSKGDYWFPDVRSLSGAVVLFSCVLYPYVYLLVRTAFLERAGGMIEAARALGLNPWQGFWRVSIPLARPAIAAGMAEGMGFGDNSRATLITRGLAEMTRLGVAMGGQPATFAGLAGMGDLIATCSSKQSRNNMVGFQLGEGKLISEVLASMTMVAEGVKSSPSVLDLARRHDVEMPITEQMVAVCHQGRPAREALAALMQRSRKSEME